MKTSKIPLLLGAILFFSMTVAHIIDFKVPVLFIYFNVPSYEYQNKIISLLTFGWFLIFLHAAYNPSKSLMKIILIMAAFAICMISYINFSTNFIQLSTDIDIKWFNFYSAFLLIYWFWLAYTYKCNYYIKKL